MQDSADIRIDLVENGVQESFSRGFGSALDRVAVKIHHHDIVRGELAFMPSRYSNSDVVVIQTCGIVAAGGR